ncbi:MAG: lysyl oxidase family protein [Actinomycetota bacterium]
MFSGIPAPSGRATRAFVTTLAALGLLTASLTPAGAQVTTPTVKLIQSKKSVTLYKYPGDGVYLDLGLFLAAEGGPFEVQVARPDYLQPPVATQVVTLPGGGTEHRELPLDVLDGWGGLDNFLIFEVENLATNEVRTFRPTFCPGGDLQRVNDEGPAVPTYPSGCYANPFTRGIVWGIDDGWAVNLFGYNGRPMRLALGRYEINVSIADRYIDLFEIDPAHSSARVIATIQSDECRHCGHRFRSASPRRAPEPAPRVPTMENPDPAILPDLQSLPAWGINVHHTRRGDFLAFGANVWTAGASSLVVEGFRRSDSDVMDAYQYFYQDDVAVGRAEVGELGFDARRGHNHWHFKQFAGYTLLNADQSQAVVSTKEAFCLAPTDMIDILLPNAVRSPYEVGLGTACGGPNAIWIREVLPLGWGDTYFQGRPGQSFNITNVPNGTYYIAVEANPGRLLHEQDYDNNITLREVILSGRPGTRRVEVPPWNGIDTENGYFGGGGKF